MAVVKKGLALRNGQAAVLETLIGAGGELRIYSGTAPSDPDAAATGTMLAAFDLPTDSFAAPASGAVAKAGTWQVAAAAAGVAGYARITDNAGTATLIQGDVTGTGGGGMLELQNTNVAAGQTITVTSFSYTVTQ